MDVHEKYVVAIIDGEGLARETRTFETYSNSLKDLRDWLQQGGISHVSMESTGVYWKSVFNILAEDFKVILYCSDRQAVLHGLLGRGI